MLLILNIELLNKIFNLLDIKNLCKLSLVSKLFYDITQENLNKKIHKEKLYFFNKTIEEWKNFLFIDYYGLEVYEDFTQINILDRENIMNDIITPSTENKVKEIVYKIIQKNFKKFYNFVDPKLFVYLIREWYENERYNHNGSFKDLILIYRDYLKFNDATLENIYKLNKYYNIITRNIQNEDIIYLIENF